jgi:hypothetical protein
LTLSSSLRHVNLTLKCGLCGHLLVKEGVWFWTASTFRCQECKGEQRLTYSDKVALFAKHSSGIAFRPALARHFADAISMAARKDLTRRELGRLVSAVSALTRANLELGHYRLAA